jgi:hypothetical protein
MFYVQWIVAIEVCSNVYYPVDSGDRGIAIDIREIVIAHRR